jgi:hypothetical protein
LVFHIEGRPAVILNVSPATRTTTRNADPERRWQSVQWQMVVLSGSASAA